MSLVKSCQYCTPTTGGHAPGCPMRLRAISTRAEWQGPPGPSCQYCTLTTLGHAPGCPTGTSVSGVTTSWRERAERADARVAELERDLAEFKLVAETDRVLAPRMKAELVALRAVAEAAVELLGEAKKRGEPLVATNLRRALAAWRATT